MAQGWNADAGWRNYLAGQALGYQGLNQGIEALTSGLQQRRSRQEKQRLNDEKEAKNYELMQAQGAFMDALAKDDKNTANTILGQYPQLVSGGYVTKAIEANRLGEQAPMTPYQQSQIDILKSRAANQSGDSNYNADIARLAWILDLPEEQAQTLIDRGALKPSEDSETKLNDYTKKAEITTNAHKEREENKTRIALGMQPKIVAAKKEAELMAKDFNEAKKAYTTLKTTMPQLRTMTNKLKKLASSATYTLPGRAMDSALRNMGFDVGEGGVHRANYIATVANQVLPLLKQTFGGAFSEAEGAKLQATLGDPNLSPEEKIAQLNAFIEAKELEIKNNMATYKQLQAEKKAFNNSGEPSASAPNTNNLTPVRIPVKLNTDSD